MSEFYISFIDPSSISEMSMRPDIALMIFLEISTKGS